LTCECAVAFGDDASALVLVLFFDDEFVRMQRNAMQRFERILIAAERGNAGLCSDDDAHLVGDLQAAGPRKRDALHELLQSRHQTLLQPGREPTIEMNLILQYPGGVAGEGGLLGFTLAAAATQPPQ